MPRLISDGGSMIVGRRTASWVWGQFEVVLPVGEEQAPQDNRIANGYCYRPDDRESGLFSLMMVRADVKLDMNAQRSDLEATLDQASRRTSGEVYYTREISGLGLGRAVPGVHYRTGDVVEVLVWGKILDLPVTAIRAISTEDDPVGAAVQVGGQPLRDPEAQRKRVHDLHTQIMTERRRAIAEEQRMKDQAQTDREQTQRIDTTVGRVDRQQEELVNWAELLRQTTNSMLEILQVVRGLSWTMRDAGQGIISAGYGNEDVAVGIGGAVVENAQNSITALNRLPVPDPIPEIEMEDDE